MAEPVADAVADLLGGVVDVLAAVDVLERLVQQHRLAGPRPAQVGRGVGERRVRQGGEVLGDLVGRVDPAAERWRNPSAAPFQPAGERAPERDDLAALGRRPSARSPRGGPWRTPGPPRRRTPWPGPPARSPAGPPGPRPTDLPFASASAAAIQASASVATTAGRTPAERAPSTGRPATARAGQARTTSNVSTPPGPSPANESASL